MLVRGRVWVAQSLPCGDRGLSVFGWVVMERRSVGWETRISAMIAAACAKGGAWLPSANRASSRG